MSDLNRFNIVTDQGNKTAAVFEQLFPSFFEVKYDKPSEYVRIYWKRYQDWNEDQGQVNANHNLNGKIFEYILSTLFIREGILPLYMGVKVAFVPNVEYDFMLYTAEKGPICLSAKTSLRERYKQADLEAIVLKNVHRKSLSFLLTLEEKEAKNLKKKVESGDIIGLNDVIVATQPEFDEFIAFLKKLKLLEPPTVKTIESTRIVTNKK